MKLRVALVCQWYPPEPTPQPAWIAEGLSEHLHEVLVLTGMPNYPSGQVAHGYRAWWPRRERIHGVGVHRTPLYPSHDGNAVRRILNYVSWALSSSAMGQGTLRKTDVALVYSSPATAALPAMLARRLWRTPYVLLVQDVWPDSVFDSGFLNGKAAQFAHRVLSTFVNAAYRGADHVCVISPGMVDLLADRGVPREKLSVVYNWVEVTSTPDLQQAKAFRDSLGIGSHDFLLMYAGNHGSAQGLDSAIDAFTALPPGSSRHLVLVGEGTQKAMLRQRADGHPNIHFVDPQARDAMPHLMAGADAQLVSLADRPLFAVTMPSKLQSVLAAGTPVLVSARGDAAKTVEHCGAGLTVEPGSAQQLGVAVERLAGLRPDERHAMGRRGRLHYESTMSRRVGVPRLASILQRAAAGSKQKKPVEGSTP